MPDNPLIKRNTRRNIKKGLTRIGGKKDKYKRSKPKTFTITQKGSTEHERGYLKRYPGGQGHLNPGELMPPSGQRGNKRVVKTTYYATGDDKQLSKRKLRKKYNDPSGLTTTDLKVKQQKVKTKFKDSPYYNDTVQNRDKKKVETYGYRKYYDAEGGLYEKGGGPISSRTSKRSKTKFLRVNKYNRKPGTLKLEENPGYTAMKKHYGNPTKVRQRSKVERGVKYTTKNPDCAYGLGTCDNHGPYERNMGNKPLKTVNVRKYEKGVYDRAFGGKVGAGASKVDFAGGVKKIRKKNYGDAKTKMSVAGLVGGKQPQYKANRGKVDKMKIKTYGGKTIRLKQNVFNQGSYFDSKNSPVKGYMLAKDFRQMKKGAFGDNSEWKAFMKTGLPARNRNQIARD